MCFKQLFVFRINKIKYVRLRSQSVSAVRSTEVGGSESATLHAGIVRCKSRKLSHTRSVSAADNAFGVKVALVCPVSH